MDSLQSVVTELKNRGDADIAKRLSDMFQSCEVCAREFLTTRKYKLCGRCYNEQSQGEPDFKQDLFLKEGVHD